jgi:hypothetical protein
VLQEEKQFQFTGPDWLLLLLNLVDANGKAKILLLLWCAWHLRNDVIHASGRASIAGSIMSLTSYSESLNIASQMAPVSLNGKGKKKVMEGSRPIRRGARQEQGSHLKKAAWLPPPQGWIKLNTDIGFCSMTGTAGIGVIARSEDGTVLLTTWRFLRICGSAEEAEAEACLEGIRLVAEWVRQSACVETDCSNLVYALRRDTERWSTCAGTIGEIRL